MSTPIRFKHKMVQFVWIPLLACTLALLYGMQPAYQGSTLGVVLNCAFLLLPVAVFIGYFSVLAYKWYSELGVSGRGIAVSGFVIALLAIAGCVMMGEFFQQERDIKIFDFATFWMATVEMRSVVETKPIHDVVALFLLRLSHEYTMVPAVPLALASYVFGQGYTGFCQSIYVLYYIPACVFVTLLAMRLAAIAGKSAGNRVLAFSVCLLLCVSNAPVAWPLMNGYVDIVGVLLLAIMMNLTLHWDGVTFSWRMVAALAILSLTTVLARRFFAFAVIGFFASFGIALLIDMVVSQRYSIARLGRLVVNMALIAAGASVLLFLLNRTIFQVFLGVNYSQA
ncbi:MAG: hypothetical protein LUC93_13225 [Planctomycetaceae bacterium]|nr:hypothetical protein [Planctomycetaceae bacterium]